jgi:hypothetical protein
MIPAVAAYAILKRRKPTEEIVVTNDDTTTMKLRLKEPKMNADGSLTSKVRGGEVRVVRVRPHRKVIK